MNITSLSYNNSLIEQSSSNDDVLLGVVVGALACTITALAGTILYACCQRGGSSSSYNGKKLFSESAGLMLADHLYHKQKDIKSFLRKMRSEEIWKDEDFLRDVCAHLNHFEVGLTDFFRHSANLANHDPKKTANLIENEEAAGFGLYTGYYGLYYLYRTRAYFDESGKIKFSAQDPDFDARFFTENTKENRIRNKQNNITKLLENYGVRKYLSPEAKNWTDADKEPDLFIKKFLETKSKSFFGI